MIAVEHPPLHLEVLVEEYSAEVALEFLFAKILPTDAEFKIHAFQGKPDLLKKLPDRLRGYKHWIPESWRIVVVCDQDEQDCQVLKQELEAKARISGFVTKSACRDRQFTVLNRIIVAELESWFLGDPVAIHTAYPKIPKNFGARKRYRDPDNIKGGTWEALEALLQQKGYHQGGLNKVEAARAIAPHMNPEQNCSASFKAFYAGLMAILESC